MLSVAKLDCGPASAVSAPAITANAVPTVSSQAMLIPEDGIDFQQEMARIEAAYLQAALRRAGGRKSAAAELLRLNSQQMKYLCRKYKLGG